MLVWNHYKCVLPSLQRCTEGLSSKIRDGIQGPQSMLSKDPQPPLQTLNYFTIFASVFSCV